MHAPLASATKTKAGFGWLAIVRIGLVQASIGALVMLATTVLNRVMVVELKLLAAIPAGLVAWHYAVQLGRPLWGHASDKGGSRTVWIVGGLAVLAAGGLLATQATLMMDASFNAAFALAVLAYALIGVGVGAGGTSALALDMAPYGVRVNGITPGFINTYGLEGEDLAQREKTVPLGRYGTPEDMTGAAAFLALVPLRLCAAPDIALPL